MAAPDTDPLRAPARSSDFYSASACRDLLMHVQEHEMSIPDLRRILEENGLSLLAFQVDDATRAAYRQRFPGDPAGRELDNWAAFEAERPRTFSAMYQLWAVKADG